MNCTICDKPIVLIPSATERAKKFGGTPNDYVRLFTAHSDCQIDKRNKDTIALMRRLRAKNEQVLRILRSAG